MRGLHNHRDTDSQGSLISIKMDTDVRVLEQLGMFPPLAVQSKRSEVLEVNRRQHQGGEWSGGKLTASWSARPAEAREPQKEILGCPLSVLPVLAREAGVLGKLPKKVLYSRQSCVCGGGRKEARRGRGTFDRGLGPRMGY